MTGLLGGFASTSYSENIGEYDVGLMLALYKPIAEGFLASLPPKLSGIVASIGSTGMAVAAIIGIVLDNLIPGTPEERGIKAPSMLVPEAGAIDAGNKD